MTKIRITKEFRFEMAHALYGYDGKCRNIHGHSYKLSVTVIGTPSVKSSDPKKGMVIDFGDLKKIVAKEIIEKFDHALLLSAAIPEKNKISARSLSDKIVFTPYQPTCENILIDISKIISKQIPAKYKLHNLRLGETNDSYAEWFAEDNK
jgi:6-pyruvoyltetrahydropterin/6-carboxytetrahydropterin synthase